MSNQSIKNLKEAFAGESQANRRYSTFAKKAERDGFPNIGRLFRAASESEAVHAYNHLKAMDGIKSTLENAEEAWKGEKDEYTEMYPMFMDQAKRDTNNDALKSFFWANEAEKKHGDFYEIKDTRSCAESPVHYIKGLHKKILDCCETAPTIEKFYSRAQAKWDVSRREIKDAVEDLCRRKLLLKIDRRLLSLVLREPVPDLPLPSENPTGFFILDMFQKI